MAMCKDQLELVGVADSGREIRAIKRTWWQAEDTDTRRESERERAWGRGEAYKTSHMHRVDKH